MPMCSNCHTESAEESRFCQSCGAELSSAVAQPLLAPPPVITESMTAALEPAKTSVVAIAALVLGILAICTCGGCGLLSVAGIICGIIGVMQTKNGQGQRRGNGLAVAGLVISGFCLIVSIPIYALIVIPKVMTAGRMAKEATLKANLQTLQHACAQFDADCGEYPNTLSQLAVPHASRPLLADGTTAPVHTYQGPYLTGQGGVGGGVIPLNPFVAASVTKTETAGTTCGNARAHWVYDNNSGHIYSGIEGTCLDGTKFDQL